MTITSLSSYLPLPYLTSFLHRQGKFKNIKQLPSRNYLLDCLIDSRNDQEQGLAENTLSQQSGAFHKWQLFYQRCSITDYYLEKFSKAEKISLLSAFAGTIRRNTFGKTNKSQLTESMVQATVTHPCSSFRANLRPDPSLDEPGQRSLILRRQLQGYVNADPAPAHEKCLPLSVFKHIATNKISLITTAIGELVTAALFFGMRNCKYSTTTGRRKMKLLQLQDLHFFQGNREINKLTELHSIIPDKVSVTFVRQKNNVKDATITMHKTSDLLCPVLAWRNITLRNLSYLNSSLRSTVNTIRRQNKTSKIKDKTILLHLRNTVDLIGHDILGFSSAEIGTYSIRSSFTMFLYLNQTRSDKIMVQGRWKSQAFLRYIRTQVSEFSAGLSLTMLKNTDFFTIPSTNNPTQENHLMFNPEVEFLNDKLYPVEL